MFALLATGLVLLTLDLTWLGWLGAPFYAALGPLRRAEANVPAVVLFYTMYLGAVVGYAVWPARGAGDAMRRGAGLGFVCYATYELTNWAVLDGWPASLVPVDVAWGVVLTAVSAGAGRRVLG